jgi:acyl carrier protein
MRHTINMATKISESELLDTIKKIIGVDLHLLPITTKISSIESWDSLNHLGILVALDTKLEGKVADLQALSSVITIQDFINEFKKNNLLID